MSITLVYTTCNRLEYAQLSLPRLLSQADEEFELVLWDNGSTDGTREYLEAFEDARIARRVLREKDEGLVAALHAVWSESDADYVGHVSDLHLVTPGWTRTLRAAHETYAGFGGLCCWSFMPEDFDPKVASHKLRTFGDHQVVAHPRIGRSGCLLERQDYLRWGPLEEDLDSFWLLLASAGRVNGWYYPLVLQERMDDPRSEHCLLADEAESELPAGTGGEGEWSREGRIQRIRREAEEILTSPTDVRQHIGWRGALRERRRRVRSRWQALCTRVGRGDVDVEAERDTE